MAEQDAGVADAAADTTTTPSIDETMSAVWDRMENGDRDDGGKFTPAEGAEPGDTAETADKAVKESTDQPASTKAPGAVTPTDAPQSWSAEDKAVFAKAPPDVQKVLLRREAERDNLLTQKSQKFADDTKEIEAYRPVIAPIAAEAARYGMPAHVAIKQLYDRHQDIAQNGIEGLKRVAAVYGLSLSGEPETAYTDPETAALKSELQTVKQTVTSWQQQQAKQVETQIFGEIDSVRLEKAKDGSLVRPHFDALFDDIIPIVASLKAKNPSWSHAKLTTEAYDRASRANPEIWGKLEGERKAKEKAEAEKEAKEAAAKAKKSASNNTRGSTAHPGGDGAKKSMDDTMGRVYDRMNSAA